jgi:anaerobic selenocysteine-containing dehydrogenase
VHVLCVNPDKAKAVKSVCSVGCTGCKLCTKQTPFIEVNGFLAKVKEDANGDDIPLAAALACPQNTIYDKREYSLLDWLTNPAVKEDFKKRSAEWKQAEQDKKAALKAKKNASEKQKNRPETEGVL